MKNSIATSRTKAGFLPAIAVLLIPNISGGIAASQEKVRIGTMSQMDVTVAQAAVASRIVDLVTAQQNINAAENNLRSTISIDRKSEIWQKLIVPADSPDFLEFKGDLDSSIDTALKNRPELQLRKAVDDLESNKQKVATAKISRQL